MKSKKIISVIAAAVLAFGVTAGAAGTMTIDEATSYAIENSPSYKSKIASAKANEYSAKAAVKTYKNYHDSDSALSQMSISSFDMYLVRMGYVKDAAEMQLRVAQRACDSAEYDLKKQVKNDFYSYLNTKEKVKIAENNLKTAEERLVEATEKRKQGTISDIEFKTFEVSVIKAKNAVSQAKRTSEFALLTFKNTIGCKADEDIEISGSFERNTEKVLKPEEVIARLDTNPNVMSLNESLVLAGEREKLAEKWYFSSENSYWTEKYTYEQAQHDYETNMNDMRKGIQELYNGLMTIDENITMLEANIELLKSNVDASKLQYELGMITANDYVENEQKYVDAQNQLIDLQLTEWITKLQYKSFYTFEQ